MRHEHWTKDELTLALDLFVYPDGRTLTLDEDEFDALNLQRDDPEAWQCSLVAVDEREAMVAARRAPFDALPDWPPCVVCQLTLPMV